MTTAPAIAAIDVGSNATRLLLRPLDGLSTAHHSPALREGLDVSKRKPIPLGYDAYGSGHIGDEKIGQLVDAFAEFAALMRTHGVVRYRAVATAALRAADNAADIVGIIADKTRLKLDIIDGEQEALLTRTSYYAQHADAPRACLFIDVGGGSSDICLAVDKQTVYSHSFAVGSMRMVCGTQTDAELQALTDTLSRLHAEYGPLHLVGAGGSIRKTAAIFPGQCANRNVPLTLLNRLVNEMRGMTIDEKINRYHIAADRARIFHEAVTIYATILTAVSATQIEAPDVGVRDGIIVSLLSNLS